MRRQSLIGIALVGVGMLAFVIGCSSAGPTETPTRTDAQATQNTPGAGHEADGPQPGQAVFKSICGGCHAVSGVSTGAVGPDLTHIGTVAAGRKSGMSADEYILESIVDPAAFLVEGYAPVMPPGLQDTIGGGFNDLLAYLAGLK